MHIRRTLSVLLPLAARLAASQGLVEVISGQDDLSTLAELLGGLPDIVGTLQDAANITVLAPSNEALMNVDADLPDIPAVLTYHVLKSVVMAADFSETKAFVPTLLEDPAFANVTGGQVVEGVLMDGDVMINGEAMVITPDLTFDGGVVHIINAVLTIPATVPNTLMAADLGALAEAATTAGLVDALSDTADLTIFAPLDSAFEAIADAAADLSADQLAAVLSYHVVAGSVLYSSLLSNTSVETLQGGMVDVAVGQDGSVMVDGASVVMPDVLVANGVVHVIDAVLMPDDDDQDASETSPDDTTAAPTPTEAVEAAAQAKIASALAALAAGLIAVAALM